MGLRFERQGSEDQPLPALQAMVGYHGFFRFAKKSRVSQPRMFLKLSVAISHMLKLLKDNSAC
jgi:hypothetical protein